MYSPMYNLENKELFIRAYVTDDAFLPSARKIFSKVGRFESEFQKDLSEMNEAEIHRVFQYAVKNTAHAPHWFGVILVLSYLRWASPETWNAYPIREEDAWLDEDILGVRPTTPRYKTSAINEVSQGLVANPKHLQNLMDAIFNDEKEETLENVYRGYLWCAFSGLAQDDTLNISKDAIDFSTLSISHNGKCRLIYRESLFIFQNLVHASTFNRVSSTPYPVPRIEGELLLRGVKANTEKDTVTQMLVRKLKDRGLKRTLTYREVYLSGLCYRLFESERGGDPYNPYKIIYPENFDHSGKELHPPTKNELSLIHRFEVTYGVWKKAFSI